MVSVLLLMLATVPTLVSAKNAPTAPTQKIVFLGDSITEGYGNSKSASYPMLLADIFASSHPHIKFVDASVSGSTSASGAKRLKWQLKSAPNYLVIALGANDGLRGIATESIESNLLNMIELAKTKKVKVLLCGMEMPPNYGADYRAKFRQTFQNVAKKTGVAFMPFLLKDVAGKREYNQPDGIHPNERGQKMIAQNVAPFLQKLFGGK